MAIDYGALLFDPVYAELGVPATLTVGAAAAVAITVIDDTKPKVMPVAAGTQAAEVRGVGPGAFARIYELTGQGVDRADYMDAALAFNGRSWIVRSWDVIGSPNGEDLGEVRFLLKEAPPPP
jgi:D-serine deaminase-like pyridoxal phosphate-dependent protein